MEDRIRLWAGLRRVVVENQRVLTLLVRDASVDMIFADWGGEKACKGWALRSGLIDPLAGVEVSDRSINRLRK